MLSGACCRDELFRLDFQLSESVHEKRKEEKSKKKPCQIPLIFYWSLQNAEIFTTALPSGTGYYKTASAAMESGGNVLTLLLLYHKNGLYIHSHRSFAFPFWLPNTDYCDLLHENKCAIVGWRLEFLLWYQKQLFGPNTESPLVLWCQFDVPRLKINAIANHGGVQTHAAIVCNEERLAL